MQQGNSINTPNLGRRYIQQTGFFDLFPKRPSWSKFQKEVCPIVLYTFRIEDGVIWINPMNVSNNNAVYGSNPSEILEI